MPTGYTSGYEKHCEIERREEINEKVSHSKVFNFKGYRDRKRKKKTKEKEEENGFVSLSVYYTCWSAKDKAARASSIAFYI